jgi:hypothetical protein
MTRSEESASECDRGASQRRPRPNKALEPREQTNQQQNTQYTTAVLQFTAASNASPITEFINFY